MLEMGTRMDMDMVMVVVVVMMMVLDRPAVLPTCGDGHNGSTEVQ